MSIARPKFIQFFDHVDDPELPGILAELDALAENGDILSFAMSNFHHCIWHIPTVAFKLKDDIQVHSSFDVTKRMVTIVKGGEFFIKKEIGQIPGLFASASVKSIVIYNKTLPGFDTTQLLPEIDGEEFESHFSALPASIQKFVNKRSPEKIIPAIEITRHTKYEVSDQEQPNCRIQ